MIRKKTGNWKNPHLWYIIIIVIVLALFYYLPSIIILMGGKIPDWFIFNMPYDLYRSLFFIPILYTAYKFGIKGTTVITLFLMLIFLPGVLFIPPRDFSLSGFIAFAVGLYISGFLFAIALNAVTVCKQAKKKIEHLNLVLHAIRKVNQLITKEKDYYRLIKGACENLTETHGYRNAWIVLFDESRKFMMSAEAGLGKSFLPLAKQIERGKLPDCGQRALSQPGTIVTKEPSSTCTDCPLSDKYAGRGALTTRLEYSGRVYGLLVASIPRAFIEDKEEQVLFQEVANDVAFALHGIELERAHREAEKGLKSAKAYTESIIQNFLDTLIVVDTEAKIKTVNPETCHLLGYTEEELIGKPVSMIFAEEVRRLFQFFRGTETRRILNSQGAIRNRELTYKTKDGRLIPMSFNASIMTNKAGNIIGVVAGAKNLTEIKKAEEARLKTEQRFRKTIENIFKFVPEGLLVFTNKLNLLGENEAFRGIIKKYSTPLNYTEQELKNIIIEQVKNRIIDKNYRGEIRITRKDR